MGELDGKVAIVTGGARGIGASIARRYVAEGARVVINDFGGSVEGTGSDSGPAFEFAKELNAEVAGAAIANAGDIADTATGEALVNSAVQEFGRLDIVANPAGILRDRMIFNLPEEDWDAVVRVHLRGVFSTVKPAAAYWREQRNPDADNRIINFTSLSGLDGAPGQPNYAAAKMGVVGLTYSLAHSLARYGVTANAISPGAATRFIQTVPQDRRANAKTRPSDDDPRRSPDNVATVALFLASERSGWLNGRVVSSVGYDVGLYRNPEVVAEVSRSDAWSFDDLAQELESEFRPHADGLPPSYFADQTPVLNRVRK